MQDIKNNEEASKYMVVSSLGMSFLSNKKAEVLVTNDELIVSTKKEKLEAEITQVYSISKSILAAPVNMIMMLLISGLSAFGCQFYNLSLTAFAVICAAELALVILGINRRVQVILNDGTIINIDSWNFKTADKIYDNLMGREKCTAQKTKKLYILEIITFLIIALFIGINAYDCFVPDKYVEIVKNTVNAEYPDTTYGNAFDKYFTETEWTSFDSKSGNKVVEFTGKYNTGDENTDVMIQYIIEGEYFRFVYFEVDGVSGTLNDYTNLIKAVFSE
ncbi:MAG: hypothetical protein Q4F11_08365 [Eubacteriales bacterium]|nr:hypothetical protein [Eubacteriales bacterium]